MTARHPCGFYDVPKRPPTEAPSTCGPTASTSTGGSGSDGAPDGDGPWYNGPTTHPEDTGAPPRLPRRGWQQTPTVKVTAAGKGDWGAAEVETEVLPPLSEVQEAIVAECDGACTMQQVNIPSFLNTREFKPTRPPTMTTPGGGATVPETVPAPLKRRVA